ncbi:hypothetical protein P692DRAFT_201811742 [Suillus brevipes Sb2]|nr:hypothetical protein P692DRAFT_201811742 [Suillus brevipes Sb2]
MSRHRLTRWSLKTPSCSWWRRSGVNAVKMLVWGSRINEFSGSPRSQPVSVHSSNKRVRTYCFNTITAGCNERFQQQGQTVMKKTASRKGTSIRGIFIKEPAELHGDADVEEDTMAIKNWFRWRIIVAHLARSGGPRGVLKLETTLSGGDEMRGTRTPQEVEINSQMHYEDRVKAKAER